MAAALKTPDYNLKQHPNVYEPREDTFLFLDALEKETPFIKNLNPKVVAEIGSGSGVIVTALSFILKNTAVYFASDLNYSACLATQETAKLNNTHVEMLHMDLLDGFKSNVFDLIVFNPPYVVTDSTEINGCGIERSWAGGVNGMEITDKLLKSLPSLLTCKGVCYLVLLKENNPNLISKCMEKLNFASEQVIERKIPGEHLFVYKYFRNSNK